MQAAQPVEADYRVELVDDPGEPLGVAQVVAAREQVAAVEADAEPLARLAGYAVDQLGELLEGPPDGLTRASGVLEQERAALRRADRLLDGFETTKEQLQAMEGFSQAYLLVDRAKNKGMTITIWESEDALLESAATADEVRKKATAPFGSTIESVDHYEIAMTVSAKQAAVG